MRKLDPDAARKKLSAFRSRPDEEPPELEGRGIVICAGGAQMVLNAYVLLDILRNVLRCELPVEVWHLGPEEMTPSAAALLREHRAEVVDARQVMLRHPASIRDGWQLKPYALLRSRFAEVLVLDADQVPISDPAAIFDWPEYRETGAVFWPDIVDLSETADIWSIAGLPAQARRAFESGQLLVDKRRHWNVLRLALFFNEEAETYYRLVYGDKDTFLLAWLLTEAASFQVPHTPFVTAWGLVQRDREGRPLFQHRTYLKWSYLGEQVTDGFVHAEECLASLDRLRRKWVGRIFHPPARSIRARAAEDALVGATLRLTAVGGVEESVTLRPDAEIGEGRAAERQHWYVAEDVDGTLVLTFHDGSRDTMRLRAVGDAWVGCRLLAPGVAITARTAGPEAPHPLRRSVVDDLMRAAGFPDCRAENLAALEASLALLARVDPSVPAALNAAVASAPAKVKRRLAEMAERIAGGKAPPLVRSAPSMLRSVYKFIHLP